MNVDYPTGYKGLSSFTLPEVRVTGEPISGRLLTVNYEYLAPTYKAPQGELRLANPGQNDMTLYRFLSDNRKTVRRAELWKQAIVRQMKSAGEEYQKSQSAKPRKLPRIGKGREFSGCNLYATFLLHETHMGEKDVDNLLKPVLDAITNSKLLVKDDVYIRDIKVRKELVAPAEDEGVILKCVGTKTFTIKKVETLAGNLFKPYWKSPVQYILAADWRGVDGQFIDNAPGCVFLDGKEAKFLDAVPGYEWVEGQTIDGCVVLPLTHHNAAWEGDKDNTLQTPDKPEEFYWLQKWSW